jgi:hypothetical protein
MKYRIYKAMIGWNVVCPCRGLLYKAMTFEGAVELFYWLLKGQMC